MRPAAETGSPATFTWKARPLFLSSTFRDMHTERDYLRGHAFLDLAEKLRERCHYLDVIDLRQGVENPGEADEAVREMRVLKVCLDEIERSRPFLVALLGDRYGWIPPADRITASARSAGMPASVEVADRSVTELEILYGVLESTDQKRRSWFYFRTLDRAGMPPGLTARFPAEEPSDNPSSPAGRLRTLKERIRKEMPGRVREYSLRWDAKQETLVGLADLDRQVAQDLFSDLDTETAAFLREAPRSWQEADARAVADFVAQRSRSFVERPAVTKPILFHALSPASPDPPWGLVVTGESGGGKSSLFGTVYDALQLEKKAGKILLLAHAAGIFPMSGQVDRMLRRWVTELAAHLGLPDPLEETASKPTGETAMEPQGERALISSEKIEKTFAELLGEAAARKRVVVLIDALNQFEPTVRAAHLTWFPVWWPDNARLVATAIPGNASATLRDRPGCAELPLPPVSRDEAHGMSEKFYRELHHRDVNPRVIATLLDKHQNGRPAHANPLWLALSLQEMNLLEADDFERADREFADLSGAERMEALQLTVAGKLPGDVPGVYGELLDRAERSFGKALTCAFTNLVALGRAGWRESDLREHLMQRASGQRWDELAFAGVRRTLGSHMVQRGAHAQWDFFHAALRETVLRRNLADESERRRLHGLLADHLEGLPTDDPLRIGETMVHLIGLGDSDHAAVYLADLQLKQRSDPHAGAALAGAVSTLVESLQAAPDDQARDRLARWIASLMEGGDVVRCGRVATVVIDDLNDALAVSGAARAEVPRRHVLDAARSFLEALPEPDRRGVTYDFAAGLATCYLKLGDLHRGLGNGTMARGFYEQALGFSEVLLGRHPRNSRYTNALAASCHQLADLHRGLGNGTMALEFSEKALGLFEKLRAQDPRSADYMRNIAASHERLGDLHHDLGNGAMALEIFEKYLHIAEVLCVRDPRNAVYRHGLAMSCSRLGKLHNDLGNAARALEFFEKALGITEELRAHNPQNADHASGLASICEDLGDLHRGLGDRAKTLEFYERALRIREELRGRDPRSSVYATDLAVISERFGDQQQSHGGNASALEFYEKALLIREMLVAQDPQDADHACGLATLYSRLGLLSRGRGDQARALEYYEKAQGISEKLVARNPQSAVSARVLAVSCRELGELHLGLGDGARALRFHKMALGILEELLARDPQNANSAHLLSDSMNKTGSLHLGLGHDALALEFHEMAMAISTELLTRNPRSAAYASGLATSYFKLGDLHHGRGNGRLAVEFHEKAMGINEELQARDPLNSVFTGNLACSCERLGTLLLGLGDGARTLTFHEKVVNIFESVRVQNPQSADCANNLAVFYERLGKLHCGHGNVVGGVAFHEKAHGMYEELLTRNPRNAGYARNLAVSHFQLSRLRQPEDHAASVTHLQACHTILRNMREAGMPLDPAIAQILARLDATIPH